MEKKNIINYTEELIEAVNDETVTIDNVVSVSFIYRSGSDKKKKIKGLNVQLYGHKLLIVPDVNDMSTYYAYVTHKEGQSDEMCRKNIFMDLINEKKYSRAGAAKLMKCSVGTVNRLLDME